MSEIKNERIYIYVFSFFSWFWFDQKNIVHWSNFFFVNKATTTLLYPNIYIYLYQYMYWREMMRWDGMGWDDREEYIYIKSPYKHKIKKKKDFFNCKIFYFIPIYIYIHVSSSSLSLLLSVVVIWIYLYRDILIYWYICYFPKIRKKKKVFEETVFCFV